MSAWRPEWDEAAREGQGGGFQLGPVQVPTWTKRLLILNAALWLLFYVLGRAGFSLMDGLALNPDWWWTSPPYLPLWQLVTYGLLHDPGGIGHLLFNSISLFWAGSMVESFLGPRRFLLLYFGSMVLGGLLHAVLSPLGVEEVLLASGEVVRTGPFHGPLVGASGAIMACIVAAAALFPNRQMLLIFVPVPLWVLAGILVAVDLLGFTEVGGQVAHHVHLVGALAGFLYIRRGWYRREVPSVVEVVAERRTAATRAERAEDDQRMDELLARIARDGMTSLTAGEKRFLKRMSQRD